MVVNVIEPKVLAREVLTLDRKQSAGSTEPRQLPL